MDVSSTLLHARVCSRFSRSVSGIAIVVGAVALVGWWRGIRALTSTVPGFATMKPLTAIAFVFSGIALLLMLIRPDIIIKQQTIARISSSFVILVGLLTLLEHWLSVDFGIDSLFFSGALKST